MVYRETEKTRNRKAAVRQRILEAAHALVAEGGFRNASVSEVATRAEVATGSVYRHFASKAELSSEVFRLATQLEVDKVGEATRGPGSCRVRLERAVEVFSRRAIKGRKLAYALIAEPVDPRVEADRLFYRNSYAELFAELLNKGIEAGEFPPQNASVSSAALVGVMSEALVGPLATFSTTTTADGQNQTLAPQSKDRLVEDIKRFCLQAVTGEAFTS